MSELPSNWITRRLGDVADVIMGQSPPGSTYNKSGDGVPFFQGKAEFGSKHPTVRQWTTAGTKFAKVGDVLMSVRAPVGPTNIADQDCAIGRGLAAIRAGSRLDQSYLIWYLKHVEASIQSRGKGTTFGAISGNDLRDTLVNLPPLDEQKRIVEALDDHLSRLDKALAEVNASLSKLETEWTSFLTKVFSGNFQGSGYSKWTFPKLNELVSTPKDIVDGPFGSNLKSSHYVDKGARVVRLQNIGYGTWVQADAFVTNEHAKTLSKHNVRQGDLLFASLMDTRPRVCIAPYLGDDAIVKSDCIRIRLQDKTVARWAMLATQTATASIWANGKVHGLGRGRLGLSAIRDFVVPMPPLNQLQEILDFIEIHEVQTGNLKSACFSISHEIQTLRKSILSKYFTNEQAAQSC